MSEANLAAAATHAYAPNRPVPVVGNSASDNATEDKPKVLMSRTTMNHNCRNALRSLHEHEMLAEFWTTFVWPRESAWDRIVPGGLRKELARRSIPEAPANLVKSYPWREVVRLSARGKLFDKLLCSGELPFSIRATSWSFDARVARRVKALRPSLVYAYEGAALETFREAERQGCICCLELGGLYWHWEQDFFSAEAERNPEFANLIPKLMDSPKYMSRMDEELAIADYIFVASEYARQALRSVVPDEKIMVISYGAPPVRGDKRISSDANRPLKVLFVGSLIQRKGIGYVLEAVDRLEPHVELTLVGSRYRANRRVDEACGRWRWYESLPFPEVMRLMQQSDVLLLPSLSDAFGLVVTEALACGLPVVVTPNTGASELLSDGREGFVVPICRADAIAEKLETLYQDRELLAEMSRQAQITAANRSWDNYRSQWANAVRSIACSL